MEPELQKVEAALPGTAERRREALIRRKHYMFMGLGLLAVITLWFVLDLPSPSRPSALRRPSAGLRIVPHGTDVNRAHRLIGSRVVR
ncbi:hypothetical protein NKH18_21195 [Streptomyces sp. M10(2022)]